MQYQPLPAEIVTLKKACAAIDAILDLIEDALENSVCPTEDVRILMGFAREIGVETVVFQRTMEELTPSYGVLVRMVSMVPSPKVADDLLAFARSRGEMHELRLACAPYQSALA